MKTKLFTLLLAMTFFACHNDDDNTPTNPIDQLPPATQVGANTAGALVNGEAFLPNNQSVIPLVCYYLDQNDFTLKLSNGYNNTLYTILISKYDTQLEEGQIYDLNTEFGLVASSGEYFINNGSPPSPNYYSTNPTITGELTITHHDYDNAILSGTFWFDAVNSEGTVVEVREGRFDMEY